MNRREFLKKGGLGVTLGLLAPSFILESCRKSSMQMNSFSPVKVVDGLFNIPLPIPSSCPNQLPPS